MLKIFKGLISIRSSLKPTGPTGLETLPSASIYDVLRIWDFFSPREVNDCIDSMILLRDINALLRYIESHTISQSESILSVAVPSLIVRYVLTQGNDFGLPAVFNWNLFPTPSPKIMNSYQGFKIPAPFIAIYILSQNSEGADEAAQYIAQGVAFIIEQGVVDESYADYCHSLMIMENCGDV